MSLVKKSDVWKYLKAKEKRPAKEIYDALDRKIAEVLDKAVEKCGAGKTIKAEDILGVVVS